MKNKVILTIIIIIIIVVLFFIHNNYMSNHLFNADGTRIDGEVERQKVINAIQNIENEIERKEAIDMFYNNNVITKEEAERLY